VADVWDEARFRRSARRWQIAVGAVVVIGASGYVCSPGKPHVPQHVLATVTGPDLRVLRTQAGPDNDVEHCVPEHVLVEVSADVPARALVADLTARGWQPRADDADPSRALLRGEAVLPPASADGDSHRLLWNTAADFLNGEEPRDSFARSLDPADPRQFVVSIDCGDGWAVDAAGRTDRVLPVPPA